MAVTGKGRGIQIVVGAEYSDKDLKRAQRDLDTLRKKSQANIGPIGKLGATLRANLGPALLAAGAAAGALAFKLGVEGVRAAIEDQKTVEGLANTLRNLGMAHEQAGVEDFIADLEFASGVADERLRPALGLLVSATGDVAEAQLRLRQAMDLAAFTGQDLDTIVRALTRSLATQSAGTLSRYGLIIDENTIKTEGFAAALDQALIPAAGAMETQAETLGGQLQRVQTQAENLLEAFGYGFLNAFDNTEDSVGDLAATLRDLQDAAGDAGEGVGSFIQVAAEAAKQLGELTDGVGSASDGTTTFAEDAWNAAMVLQDTLLGPVADVRDAAWAYFEASAAAGDATTKFGDAAERAKQQNLDFAGSIDEATVEVDELTSSLENLSGFIDSTKLVLDYEAAWDDLRDSIKENGKNFDETTEKGRKNTTQLLKAAEATAKYAMDQETVADRSRVAREGIERLSEQFERTPMSASKRAELLEPFEQLLLDLEENGTNVDRLQSRIDGLKGKTIRIAVLADYTGLPAGVSKEDLVGMARGGLVGGRGGPTADLVPAVLSRGEFVVRAQAVNSFGPDFFDALNRGINPLRGMEAPRMSDRGSSTTRTMVIENINVTAAGNEPAEVTVPRALRRMAWVSGLDG